MATASCAFLYDITSRAPSLLSPDQTAETRVATQARNNNRLAQADSIYDSYASAA
eukprot:CAMPEP_0170186756 /NCGR_PEP_ID=MMETSP0040_2-20121228/40072_1 /TAXON_ID=641309 /ORGANISM="Lotharella oceanica, Strain CCMP622" /LENGTH=54 /DNA_ID=CAMNT_0010433615 /DNA_START=1064 /DNA_END=1225 /DNA_ORIENTATION=+